MTFYLKADRGPATELDDETGGLILSRGRHQGRRIVEVLILYPDGRIERCEERVRRKLGSNAISSRTWLAQTYMPDDPDQWGNDRYFPSPQELVDDADPAPDAAVLVLIGAEGETDAVIAQLRELAAHR